MFDIGFSELLLFGAIALIILGPEKLPHAARTAGRYYAKFRRTVATLQSEIEAELDLAETRKQMQEEFAKIKQAEANMKREMEALRSSMNELQQHGTVPPLQTEQNNPASTSPIAEQVTSEQATNQYPLQAQNLEADEIAKDLHAAVYAATEANPTQQTEPMYHQWFLLGDYDKQRRLPNAPRLPNYQADKLLNQKAYATPLSTEVANG